MIDQEHARLVETRGFTAADQWRDGMLAAIRSLATYPNRCPIAPENRLFSGGLVRPLLHSHGRGSVWRILFTVHEADANDPATVQVQHVRHGAQALLTEWPDEETE